MKSVRIGIIGMGNMGKFHADYLINKKVARGELTAVSDAFPANLERYKQFKTYEKSEELIRSGEVDAVIIATPHYLHTSIGIDALQTGLQRVDADGRVQVMRRGDNNGIHLARANQFLAFFVSLELFVAFEVGGKGVADGG